ncbi:MAG: restriction endonuclease subunit S [Oscillospiraceae bacterium]|nr:restriction endonuclease subunit S [Oscillospiraceae bacterium]
MREMKNSGVPWIGMIPDSWSVGRVKDGFVRKKQEAHQDNPTILSLARAGVRVRDMSNNEGQIAESYYNYNIVSKGDLLINPMDLYSGANCSVSHVEGVISPAYINLGAKRGYNSVYYDYYFKTQYWAMALFAHGKGVSFDNRWTLSNDDLMRYLIPVPSVEEQANIANYLDTECSRIDSVIDQTRASIEEYKKLKQSVITQAVTKGIRPNRKMKDSGIEWIGEIPEEWETTKIKYISSGVGDGLHAAPEYIENGLYYFINGNNLGDKEIRIKENTNSVSEEEYSKYNQPVLCTNAILIALNGTYGLVSFYNGEKIMLGKSAGYINLIPTIERNYVRYALLSDYSKRQMDDSLAGTTIANVSLRTIRNISIAWPSEIEQEEISRYLDAKCFELDRLLTGKTQLINELESYKKSLIYEYVTGKKEVV